MVRQLVSSTNVRSIGYDDATDTLAVEFHSGGIYQYFDVPKTVYAALMLTVVLAALMPIAALPCSSFGDKSPSKPNL